MKDIFFNIKLTKEQQQAIGRDVKELVAVDFCKVKPSETDGDRLQLELTRDQARYVRELTGEDPRNLRITWRAALEELPPHDIKAIEDVTLRGCDTWSVPAPD